MNILFLTLGRYKSLSDGGLYSDLIKVLIKNGNNVFLVSPIERRENGKTELLVDGQCSILRVKTLNIQKTNLFEKGIGSLLLPKQYLKAIKKHFRNTKFDLILYPTPPITIYSLVRKIKKRYKARTYLMLKDIFPQNAIDLGILKKNGLKGVLYRHFRKTEKKLYSISDRIGCMSNANINYILKNNSEINKDKVELFPNCIDPSDRYLTRQSKNEIRKKYNLPIDKKIFVYGGNLGKPQDIDFALRCINECKDICSAYFVIVGSGTEAKKIEAYLEHKSSSNLSYINQLPKFEFLTLLQGCDYGLIFLNYNFSIPNFPSRFLSYLEVGLPVYACTDSSTDIGQVITANNLGWWSPSNDEKLFKDTIVKILNINDNFKYRCFNYLKENYNCNLYYKKIMGD